jgi:hypothetical protein
VAKPQRSPTRRLRLPNSRGAAILVAAGLALLGFGVGLTFLVLAPMARSGQGVFSFLKRSQTRLIFDARLRPSSQPPLPTLTPARPELWQTPVADLAFPSPDQWDELNNAAGSVEARYVPNRTQRVLATPPILDALKRPVIAAVVAFGADADDSLPGPRRPDASDATRLTISANGVGDSALLGCVLTVKDGGIKLASALGDHPLAACQQGIIRVSDSTAISFAVSTEILPNYRARDGVWQQGGAFGQTRVRFRLRDPAA